MTDLDEIRDALEAATPGPWTTGRIADHLIDSVVYGQARQPVREGNLTHVCQTELNCEDTAANADLIAKTPGWLSELIVEVQQLRYQRDLWKDAAWHALTSYHDLIARMTGDAD